MGTLLRKARIAVTPRSWLLKRTLSNGAVVYGKNTAGYGGRGVFIDGDAIEAELLHLEHFLDKDAVFIDIGANTGIYTLKAAKLLHGAGFVIAVEPGLDSLTMLAYSARANGFTNVRLRNFCMGERTTQQTLWLNDNKPNSFSLVRRADESRGVSVLTVSLDDLCAWEQLTRLDYLKIDVVGAEAKVLQGAQQVIQRFRPLVQVSTSTGYVPIDLPGYYLYQVADAPLNVIHVPSGDARIARLAALGWHRIEA